MKKMYKILDFLDFFSDTLSFFFKKKTSREHFLFFKCLLLNELNDNY